LPLYEQNLSLSEISRRTGFARTTIGDALHKRGVAIRASQPVSKYPIKKPINKRSGITPYGYKYQLGVVVVEPTEHPIVIEIYRQWQSGKAFRAIASNLNDRGIPTRKGKSWTHEMVKRVINRHEEQMKQTTQQQKEEK
jgi:hypothetical protein